MLETHGSERGDASTCFSPGARVGTRIAGCSLAPDRDPALILTLTLHPEPSRRQRYFPLGPAANRPLSRSGHEIVAGVTGLGPALGLSQEDNARLPVSSAAGQAGEVDSGPELVSVRVAAIPYDQSLSLCSN